MEVNALEKVINYFGSTTQVAKVLGIKQQSVSGWCYGRSNVPLEIALHIELLMCGEVTWKDLVPFEVVYRLRNFCLSLKEAGSYPCELTHVLMNRIISPDTLKNQQNQPVYLHRPPCIDENYTLIFGYETFYKYQNNNKRTIPCWKISLASLYEGKYVTEDLTKAFLISERVATGMALGIFIGNRQGQRNDLQRNESKRNRTQNERFHIQPLRF
ncbi:transcriptional regulator [Rickettsiella massiliensis]|uniref:transcriptional regulator n=1 Tax=Rickettsiella massiliensis TaxID=676517 RepID=UPI000299E44A|nr:Cro/CI family transcriptional regulator [Rickettsiella massiliensis]